MIESCNDTSVGILVRRNDRLLLIERRKPPYGWAPPAGHVDDGETYAEAATRELREEVGLEATELRHLLTRRYENRCRRPGGDHHHWQVFEATCDGSPEQKSRNWCSGPRLISLPMLALNSGASLLG
jgi:ADP-ribose pyrophosphatase YjhB (NUDIX family)